MRVLAVMGLVLFLLAQPAVSQVPDDKLVVPGQRIGKWTLDMTINALVEMNGARNADGTLGIERPVQLARVGSADWADTIYLHAWSNLFMFVGTLSESSQQVVLLATYSADYKTAQGLAVGALPRDVETLYGKPTATTRMRTIYDPSGLSVRIFRSEVQWLGVFRPGTAKQIWKW